MLTPNRFSTIGWQRRVHLCKCKSKTALKIGGQCCVRTPLTSRKVHLNALIGRLKQDNLLYYDGVFSVSDRGSPVQAHWNFSPNLFSSMRRLSSAADIIRFV